VKWSEIDWGMAMGMCADEFGYTPAQFYALTLPQLTALQRYLVSKYDEDGAKPSRSARTSSQAGTSDKTVDSLDELVAMFGSPESRAALYRREVLEP
jgi:hypothetical protein